MMSGKLSFVLALLALISIIIILIVNACLDAINKKPCDIWNSLELNDTIQTNSDGSVISHGIKFEKNEIFKDGNVLRGCICVKNYCLRKCCPKNQLYVMPNGSPLHCADNREGKILNGELKNLEDFRLDVKNDIMNITIVVHELKNYCKNGELISFSNITLIKNSSLVIIGPDDSKEWVTINDYCVDMLENETIFFKCFKKDEFDYEEFRLILYPTCMCLSIPFLVATLLIYWFLPELNNLFGKCLSCLTFSKIISYIVLSIIQFEGAHIGPVGCTILGYISQYSLLASFFWLNIMCFDIWSVLRSNTRQSSLRRRSDRKKFIRYSIYAWGMPVIICASIFAAEYLLPIKSEFKPMMGEKYCTLNARNKSTLIFYFFPLTILFILNISMFIEIAINIIQHEKQMAPLKNNESQVNNKTKQEGFDLYTNLFFVMGITWLAEPLSSLFNEKPAWLWILLDVINILQCIMLFNIFVLKKSILRKVTNQLCPSLNFFNESSSNLETTKSELTLSLKTDASDHNVKDDANKMTKL